MCDKIVWSFFIYSVNRFTSRELIQPEVGYFNGGAMGVLFLMNGKFVKRIANNVRGI